MDRTVPRKALSAVLLALLIACSLAASPAYAESSASTVSHEGFEDEFVSELSELEVLESDTEGRFAKSARASPSSLYTTRAS